MNFSIKLVAIYLISALAIITFVPVSCWTLTVRDGNATQVACNTQNSGVVNIPITIIIFQETGNCGEGNFLTDIPVAVLGAALQSLADCGSRAEGINCNNPKCVFTLHNQETGNKQEVCCATGSGSSTTECCSGKCCQKDSSYATCCAQCFTQNN